jgi:hypothetical protein
MADWKAIEIKVESNGTTPLYKALWGADIWINGVPVLKSLILANIIVWSILFTKRY